MLRSKKADIKTLGKIVLVLVLLGISLYIAYNLLFKTGQNLEINCNNDQMRCACFFTSNSCPEEYITKSYNNELCPPDRTDCSQENFEELLETAKDQEKFGTCCKGAIKQPSDRLLKHPLSSSSELE